MVERLRFKHTLAGLLILALLLGAHLMSQPAAMSSQSVHPHHDELLNPDGSWKYTNALAHETSPYLLQHAHNPVDWRPWGPAAFDEARQTGKPIFLSIGYSTCYWCHVMERQVFENPELAAMANEHFICIKVDREERPDVDDIYMAALQLMTGHGGWPMSVFLTPPGAGGPDDPGLKPFWAATYIPPEPRHGMPGFGNVVTGLSKAWADQKNDVLTQADRLADAVREHLSRPDPGGQLSANTVQNTVNQILQSYDPANGGFGDAPKFPQPAQLLLLIRVYQNNPNQELWKVIANTLDRMSRGGMYDQIGGGFHRYSTDEKWLVPHFEKMLYDNALLTQAYALAHEAQPDPRDPEQYARVARETLDYVLREMTDPTTDAHPGGAFWSAQDAEVDAREGGNYLWTPTQVREALPNREDAALALKMYGLDLGTNFQDPHHRDEPPTNVLYLPERLGALATSLDVPFDELIDTRQRVNRSMLAARDQRKQPSDDDKVLASWNGLMIAAFADAGRVLEEPRYTQAASRAAETILARMRPDDDRLALLHTMRQGESKIPAFLEDYTHVVHGLIALHHATGDRRWLDAAEQLTETADQRFSARPDRGGGYYDTLDGQSHLFVRTVSSYDGAVPSGNGQMIHNLISLYELTGKQPYLDRAVADLRAFSGALAHSGQGMTHMTHALLRALIVAPSLFDNQPPATKAKPATPDITVLLDPDSFDRARPDTPVTLTITIPAGLHLNGSDADSDGLIPTRLTLNDTPGFALEVSYPKTEQRRFDFADGPLDVYEGRVVITARLAAQPAQPTQPDPADADPRLVLTYQLCSDAACYQPQEKGIPISIR